MSEELSYVSRVQWGARNPTLVGYEFDEEYPLQYVVVTYTNTPQCLEHSECLREVKRIQDRDMDEEDLPDIKYNWLVGGDGRLYEGTGWSKAAIWADRRQDPYAYNSICVAFIYDLKDPLPNKLAQKSLKRLLTHGAENNFIKHPISLVKLTAYEDQMFKADSVDF